MREELEKKVQRAIKLIQSASKIAAENGCPEIEVAYSGGKDSDVILELTKMSGVPYRAIYKNTTIDPVGTIKHAWDMGAEIIRPKKSFFELVRQRGFPTMFVRFCCSELKEYKILDYAIIGVRREESTKRMKRYKEPEMCRVFSKNVKARHYMPILEWTSEDVAEFISERGIKCHPLYYDEDGVFHAERRCGCLACPLISPKLRIEQFKQHPNLVKAWIRAGEEYRRTHPNAKRVLHHKDVYAWFVHELFYATKPKEWDEDNSEYALFPPPNYKQFLEDYFKIKFKD